jgi:hypothetical protein
VYHSVTTRLEIARAQCPGMPELTHMIESEPFVDAMCDSSFMLPAAKLLRSYPVLFGGGGVYSFGSEHHASTKSFVSPVEARVIKHICPKSFDVLNVLFLVEHAVGPFP